LSANSSRGADVSDLAFAVVRLLVSRQRGVGCRHFGGAGDLHVGDAQHARGVREARVQPNVNGLARGRRVGGE
jgi:hypothetical protein